MPVQEINLMEIEKAALAYSEATDRLRSLTDALQETLAAEKRAMLKPIRAAAQQAKERRGALAALVDIARHLFGKPRTLIFHSIKVGLQKGRGGITWDDSEHVVRRIEAVFGEEAESYLHITKRPNKEALEGLAVAELTRLGCQIEESGDQVLVRPVAGDVETIVNRLLADAPEEG